MNREKDLRGEPKKKNKDFVLIIRHSNVHK